MLRKVTLSVLFVSIVACAAHGQVIREWDYLYGYIGDYYDGCNDAVLDPNGNIIVVGTGYGTTELTSQDIITIKLYPNGDTAWVRVFENDSLDHGYAVDVDASGNIYVIGDIDYTGTDAYTWPILIKYLPNGYVDWIQTVPPDYINMHSSSRDVVVDDSGYIYTTGTGHQGSRGYLVRTAKYNADGILLWQEFYDYGIPSWVGTGMGWCIEADAAGNVYVGAHAQDSLDAESDDVLVLKYDSDGSLQWASSYSTPGENMDYVYDIAVGADGSVYAAGRYDGDFGVVAFTPSGDTAWTDVFDGGWNGPWEQASGVEVDGAGNIVVAGWLYRLMESDFYVAKYSPDGTVLWDRIDFTGPSSTDKIYGLALDKYNQIYVVGSSDNVNVQNDPNVVTVKYSSSGDMLWEQYYDGPDHSTDVGSHILVTDDDHVVSCGNIRIDEATNDVDIGVLYYSQPGCCLLRSDIDYNGSGPDISDLVYLVSYMFNNGPAPPCIETADIDGNGSGPDISDLVYLVSYMFNSGPAPVPCP